MSDEVLTIEKMMDAIRRLPAPLPKLHLSSHATELPVARPHTDDMHDLVERVGQSRVPAAFKFVLDGREHVVAHPSLLQGSKRHE